VTFQDEFSASKEKAYNRNIATKILEGMSKLRGSVDSSPTTQRRWIWELIQNAKDVNIEGHVRVRIDAALDNSQAHVTFKHSGSAFSAENIRFLIEQVSSKDRTNDETGRPRTTGKFGTGFLTTHLLSEHVTVEGVAQGASFGLRKFTLELDRSGADLEDIIEAVQDATASIQDLDNRSPYTEYVPGALNTSFRYKLVDNTGKMVATAGLTDLNTCLPYVLIFVREIETVDYPNRQVRLQGPRRAGPDREIQYLSVTSTDSHSAAETSSFAVLSNGLTTIALPVEHTDEGIRILPLSANVPRLFCDFPLLGTETFPFPVIINNPTFFPTEPRDGVFLTTSERARDQIGHNKGIIKEALDLYYLLLSHAAQSEWHDLHRLAAVSHNLSELDWLDHNWYNTEILKPMRDTLQGTSIVRTAAGNIAPITSVWFPSSRSIETRSAIWRCYSTWSPEELPVQSDVEAWHGIIWPECKKLTLDQIAESIEKAETIEKLADELQGYAVYGWLMDFYATLKLDEAAFNAVVNKRHIFPNQNGSFDRRAALSRDAGDIDPTLLDILELLGDDLRDQLLDARIGTNLDDMPTKDEAFVVKEITATIQKTMHDRNAIKSFRPALAKLLLWFRDDESRAIKLFPILFNQKHLLYDDDEILANHVRAEELSDLLSEYNVKNVTELRALLGNHKQTSQLLPLTEEIIASLGITSVEEWTRRLKDKNLAALFSHSSTPTFEMFLRAQGLIAKAKKRVIEHLSTLVEYDLSAMDETALTVLAGVKKDNREVSIVVRPAYDGMVIIYYQSERDVLDYEDHELWVDTDKDVRRITFGYILKKTGIRRFPI
jgi:hypothetical protein